MNASTESTGRMGPDRVLTVVAAVPDPELPHVTIGDLGIVREVVVDGCTVTVVLTPTYTGCPATEQIAADVAGAVRAAGYEPDVRTTLAPAWTTDWITPRGRRRLLAAGIAPPPPAGAAAATAVDPPVACPRCGSRRTRRVGEFGSTACKANYTCTACAEPFEQFKPL